MYTILGLGNPGEEYEKTRHNTGRMALEIARKKFNLPEWEAQKKSSALISAGVAGGVASKSATADQKILFAMPETFMNKSGVTAAALVKSQKAATKLIVVYDDLDLPIGKMKISFNRSSGGHRGVESIIRALKTESFVRIRVGIAPVTPSGKIKKPAGDEAVAKFIVAPFRPNEEKELKKVLAKIPAAVQAIISEGHERAMGSFNQS
ncbi:MAG: aminoacyl-tRNA hydrolase [Patescibacteria group bacterium]